MQLRWGLREKFMTPGQKSRGPFPHWHFSLSLLLLLRLHRFAHPSLSRTLTSVHFASPVTGPDHHLWAPNRFNLPSRMPWYWFRCEKAKACKIHCNWRKDQTSFSICPKLDLTCFYHRKSQMHCHIYYWYHRSENLKTCKEGSRCLQSECSQQDIIKIDLGTYFVRGVKASVGEAIFTTPFLYAILLTFVFVLANSILKGWLTSGSKRTP